VVEREENRLLRQWWNGSGDYSWVVEFLGPRGFLTGLRVIVGTGGLLMGLALLCLLTEHLARPRVISHSVVAEMAVASFGWAVFWWFFRWPSARKSAALFALADIGIAVATAVHANPLAALSTTPLFAMTGAFIVFFFGPRVNAVHIAFATATIVATAVWLVLSDEPDAVPTAISKSIIALTVTVAIFPFVQFGFWLVRNNSIESLTDPLTDLANRRGLSNYLSRKVNRMTSPLEPLCAFVVDLDGFKNINDEYGHKIGDAVIARTAEQIRLAVRPSAFVARTGGEEFVVVDLLKLSAAAAVGEKSEPRSRRWRHQRRPPASGLRSGPSAMCQSSTRSMPAPTKPCTQRKRGGGNRIALGGTVNAANSGWQQDEIPFRPIQLDGGRRARIRC